VQCGWKFRWIIFFGCGELSFLEGFAPRRDLQMALAYSASPVVAQLQQSLCQSASRGGVAPASHGVSWTSSFGTVRVFHSAQIRSGDLDSPFFAFFATLYFPLLSHFLATTYDMFLSKCCEFLMLFEAMQKGCRGGRMPVVYRSVVTPKQRRCLRPLTAWHALL
jgi:hypothetical protein